MVLYLRNILLLFVLYSTCEAINDTTNEIIIIENQFLQLSYNDTPISHILLMERDVKLIQFILDANIDDEKAASVYIEKYSDDGLDHFSLEYQNLSIEEEIKFGIMDRDSNNNLIGQVNVTGEFIGFGYIKFNLLNSNNTIIKSSNGVSVKVLREKTALQTAFVAVIIILISIAYINMACSLDIAVIKKTVRRPIAPMIGLASQYLIMPLMSFGVGYFLLEDRPELWLGLFLTGCSPGGGGSNVWTYLLGGSLDLSITMTFISTIASYAAFPLWVLLLGRIITSNYSNIQIPYKKITMLILGFMVPIGIGLLITKFSPKCSQFLKKMLKPLALFFIIFVTIFGVICYYYIFFFVTWSVIFASAVLPWMGFLSGMLLGLIFRQTWEDIIAISIETGVQQTGLAIGVLQIAFQNEEPMGDIGILMPIMVATMTPLPLYCVYILQIFRNRSTKGNDLPSMEDSKPINQG